MFALDPSPRISKAISQIRELPDIHHKNVLNPLEKYCVDRVIESIMKKPYVDFYLKTILHNITADAISS